MSKVIDLQEIAAGDALVAIVVNRNPDGFNRIIHNREFIKMAVEDEETRVVGVRFPVSLLKWLDSYSRIAAVNSESRITRNSVIVGFLETQKALMEHISKTQWGGKSHQQMIADVLNGVTVKDTAG